MNYREMRIILLLIIAILDAQAGSGPQLNTFKVAPSSSSLDNGNSCGGMNVTYSVACGTTPRINANNIRSNVAAFGEFPWQVAIVDAYEQKFLCSGVLLSHKTVLTASHCVADIPTSDLRVRLGEWDILSDEDPRETYQSVEIPVSKKYFHPDMELSNDRMSEFHSVSLLKLRKNINFGEFPHVAPACVPAPLQVDQQLPMLRCFVAGWSESPLQPLQSLDVERHGTSQRSTTDSPAADMSREQPSTRVPAEPTPQPSHSNNGYDDSACYTTSSPRQRQQRQQNDREWMNIKRAPSRNNLKEDFDEMDDASEVTWSRILGKAQARVVPRDECLQLSNDIGELDTSSLCLFPSEEYSHPCQADIGAAVMCEMPAHLQRGKRGKESRDRDDLPKQLSVVGIVTRSYSCSDMPTQLGKMPQQIRNKPVIAISILRILDQVCKVAGTTK